MSQGQHQQRDLLHQVHQRRTTNLAILQQEVPQANQSFCHVDELLVCPHTVRGAPQQTQSNPRLP